MFSNCRSLKSIIISSKVTVIDTCAFMGCNSLSSVIVPPSVTFIHRSAFDDCYDVVLFVAENSYAHQWAISNNVAFKLNTVAINSITVKYTAREAGEPNRYYATAQGGATPYTYYFRLYKDDAVYHNSGWISADNYRIDFTEAGTYTMSVRVQDANGNKSDWVSGGKTVVQ